MMLGHKQIITKPMANTMRLLNWCITLMHDTKQNRLGCVSLTHALMVLTLALVNSPNAYCMDDTSETSLSNKLNEPQSKGLSNKRLSCSSFGLGDPAGLADKQHGEPVVENNISKIAKVAGDTTKAAAQAAKPHAEDMALTEFRNR